MEIQLWLKATKQQSVNDLNGAKDDTNCNH